MFLSQDQVHDCASCPKCFVCQYMDEPVLEIASDRDAALRLEHLGLIRMREAQLRHIRQDLEQSLLKHQAKGLLGKISE